MTDNFKCECDHVRKTIQVDLLPPYKEMYCQYKCSDGYVSPNE